MKRRALVLGGYNTAVDGLFTTAKLHLETPKIVENYIEVAGMHGSLDCCEATAGTPVYKSRALTAVFETSRGTIHERQKRIDALIRHAHGKRLPIIHPDYPGRYLMGRITLQKDFNNLAYGQVSLTAVCEPWFYAMHKEFLDLPILDRSHNHITLEQISVADELSTAGASYVGDTEIVTVLLSSRSGAPHTQAVFRIAAEPNTSYYLSARISGKCFWRVSNRPQLPDQFDPLVTTGEDGVFYIFLVRLQPEGGVNLQDVLCLKTEDLTIISAGDAPSELGCRRPDGVEVVVSMGGLSLFHGRYSSPAMETSAGDTVVAAFRRDTTQDPGIVTLQWQRRWL